jgi:hypothetical protein
MNPFTRDGTARRHCCPNHQGPSMSFATLILSLLGILPILWLKPKYSI